MALEALRCSAIRSVSSNVCALMRYPPTRPPANLWFRQYIFQTPHGPVEEKAKQTLDACLPLTVSGHEYDLEREFYIVHLEEAMVFNPFMFKYTVEIGFVSAINDLLDGFYRSSYVQDGNLFIEISKLVIQS